MHSSYPARLVTPQYAADVTRFPAAQPDVTPWRVARQHSFEGKPEFVHRPGCAHLCSVVVFMNQLHNASLNSESFPQPASL